MFNLELEAFSLRLKSTASHRVRHDEFLESLGGFREKTEKFRFYKIGPIGGDLMEAFSGLMISKLFHALDDSARVTDRAILLSRQVRCDLIASLIDINRQ